MFHLTPAQKSALKVATLKQKLNNAIKRNLREGEFNYNQAQGSYFVEVIYLPEDGARAWSILEFEVKPLGSAKAFNYSLDVKKLEQGHLVIVGDSPADESNSTAKVAALETLKHMIG